MASTGPTDVRTTAPSVQRLDQRALGGAARSSNIGANAPVDSAHLDLTRYVGFMTGGTRQEVEDSGLQLRV